MAPVNNHKNQFKLLRQFSRNLLVATQAAAIALRNTENPADRKNAHTTVTVLHKCLCKIRQLMKVMISDSRWTTKKVQDEFRNIEKDMKRNNVAFLCYKLSADGAKPNGANEQAIHQVISMVKQNEMATGFNSDKKIFSIINEVDKQVKSLVNDDFDPPRIPRIVFVGAQSSGKSVVAQRFLSLGVFPSSKGTTTLYPREVRLRSLPKSSPITVSVEHTLSLSLTRELKHSKDLSAKLSEMVQQVQDDLGRQIMKEPLIITVSSPSVSMDIDVVDLPGYLCNASTEEGRHRVNSLQDILKTYIQSNVEHSLFVVVQEPQEDQLYPFLGFLSQIESKLTHNLKKVFVLTKPDVSVSNFLRAQETYRNWKRETNSVWALRNPGVLYTDGPAMKISYREAQCIEDDWFYSVSLGQAFTRNDEFSAEDSRSWNPENWGMISLREHILTRFHELTEQHFTSLINHALDTLEQTKAGVEELKWISSPRVWRQAVLTHVRRALISGLPTIIDSVLQSVNVNQSVSRIVNEFRNVSVTSDQVRALYDTVTRHMNSYERWNQLSMDQGSFNISLQNNLRRRLRKLFEEEARGLTANQHLEQFGTQIFNFSGIARAKIAYVRYQIMNGLNAFVDTIVDIQFIEEAVSVNQDTRDEYDKALKRRDRLVALISGIGNFLQ